MLVEQAVLAVLAAAVQEAAVVVHQAEQEFFIFTIKEYL
jgi:hypothetical protein